MSFKTADILLDVFQIIYMNINIFCPKFGHWREFLDILPVLCMST